jgi:poly-gamma-glutamate synthesis protein (capsule biosynthesis protein)
LHFSTVLAATAAAFVALAADAEGTEPEHATADPVTRSADQFDPRRPVEAELRTRVPDGYTVGVVGDLIASRPVGQYAARLPDFKSVLDLLKQTDVLYGNMESTILDMRSFRGAPYSFDGDWTNSSLPEVAKDLAQMGFRIVSRANNHVMDWGIEGMRETGRRLDEAGIVHAGAGEGRGLARAAQYYESPHGRVAIVSFASTFRPTTEALPSEGAAPGRPGLSALHVTRTTVLPPDAMKALVAVDCATHGKHCGEMPEELELFDGKYRLGDHFFYDYRMDPEDLAEILKSIREAKENADLVVAAIHTHDCSTGCDDDDQPRGPGNFMKALTHAAIDAGADVFVATGNHNLGPVEIYDSPRRGRRAIFYGLGNFFWSDIQVPLPHDLFQGNREMLAKAWTDPSKATAYDLTAPLNRQSFAHDFTFRSVVARCRFAGGQLAAIELSPIEDRYGAPLTESGIPRLVTDDKTGDAIIGQIDTQNARFGLPPLAFRHEHGAYVATAGN